MLDVLFVPTSPISAWWIPAYLFYHLTLSAVLMGTVSKQTLDASLQSNGFGFDKFASSVRWSVFNFLVVGTCVYGYSFFCPNTENQFLLKLLSCILIADIWFYTTHRILHHPRLFKYIHSIHHQWRYPIPFISYYCHPIENLLCNLGSVLVPVMIVGGSTPLLHVWILFTISQSTVAHAGELKIFPTSKHDRHHKQYNMNYGINLFMDRVIHL